MTDPTFPYENIAMFLYYIIQLPELQLNMQPKPLKMTVLLPLIIYFHSMYSQLNLGCHYKCILQVVCSNPCGFVHHDQDDCQPVKF